MSYFVYAGLYLAVLINFAGYVYLLAYIRRVRPLGVPEGLGKNSSDVDLPQVVVLVPTHNEARCIERKLENLRSLDYPPARLLVLVADGESTDETASLVEAVARRHPEARVRLIRVREANKIAQLNAALALCPADSIVVVTDADAQLETRDALLRTVTILSDATVGLVGGWCMPPGGGPVFGAEAAYWDKQNRLRYMETVCFSSSIVVAPFYAFRAGFLTSFLPDCVADDVYVSLRAHDAGLRVLYTPAIRVTEERQPGSVVGLVHHKYRKIHAYTTELLRIAHRLPHMRRRHRVIVLFKLLQMFILPMAVVFFGVSTLHLLAMGQWVFLAITQGVLLLLGLGASLSMAPPPGLTRGGLRPASVLPSAFVFVMITILLVVNVFVFPFYRQEAHYTRVTG